MQQLAVMMITVELAARLGQPPPAVHCLDPGTVNSKLLDKGWGMIGMDMQVRDRDVAGRQAHGSEQATGRVMP